MNAVLKLADKTEMLILNLTRCWWENGGSAWQQEILLQNPATGSRDKVWMQSSVRSLKFTLRPQSSFLYFKVKRELFSTWHASEKVFIV